MKQNPSETKSKIINPNFLQAGDEGVAVGRAGTQGGWYEFSATFCNGHEVLDVGCGLGKGLEILEKTAKNAYGIDVDARLEKNNIFKKDICDIPSKSVDTVVCIDVIEHVKDDIEFANHLARVARKQILLSTPNFAITRCQWPYHIREYMPHELYEIFQSKGQVTMYKGPQFGDKRHLVSHFPTYAWLNKLRINPVVGFPIRCFNKLLLPESAKIHGHLFLRVIVE